ncbi:ATP-binding protein [Pseudomonas sp. dw_358]|uniref:ATP-binding protein n=1 Tax=Pseudomonas sp. dw_358 TaxID=2720083 RepID=UPI001BD37B0B|nr:ATP-binding protein [Pseudomonas sp. dw_358]
MLKRIPRFIPDSLFGRLVIILVLGTLAAQMATSSIWFDKRHGQALEIPTRLIGTRLGDILQMVRRQPDQLQTFIDMVGGPQFKVRLTPPPTLPVASLSDAGRATEQLLRQVIEARTGHPVILYLRQLQLLDGSAAPAGLAALLSASGTLGRFSLDVQVADGRWLQVDAEEAQGWTSNDPWDLVLDYVVRIYLLRIGVVVLIALLAVRLVIAPLNRMARAAQALGKNLHREPLPIDGPQEVRRAAEAFNAMQQRLIETIAERTRVVAAISHDLRSPITRMRLRAELVNEEPLRDALCRDIQQMEQMVASTLDFASSSQSNEARQTVDVNSLVSSLQANLEDEGHPVQVLGQASRPVSGYPRSLGRCLQNLMENGLRYGAQVQVVISETSHRVRIVISDKGPGIPEAMLEQVFEPFFRLESSRNQGTGGYGLGLSIARSVAEAHDGTLVLSNAPGGGLQAVLELPAG